VCRTQPGRGDQQRQGGQGPGSAECAFLEVSRRDSLEAQRTVDAGESSTYRVVRPWLDQQPRNGERRQSGNRPIRFPQNSMGISHRRRTGCGSTATYRLLPSCAGTLQHGLAHMPARGSGGAHRVGPALGEPKRLRLLPRNQDRVWTLGANFTPRLTSCSKWITSGSTSTAISAAST